MKYLKTYNERLSDILVSRTDEEIFKKLKNKSLDDILYGSMSNNFLKGVIYALDKNNNDILHIKNKILNNIYYTSPEIVEYIINNENTKKLFDNNLKHILEKYKLGLHQNEEKEYEIWFKDILLNSVPLPTDDKTYVYYKHPKYGLTLLNATATANIFNINYTIWDYFEEKYFFDYYLIKFLTKKMIEKYLNESDIITQRNNL